MMLMSGVKRASTIVPTITARNTIMIGSSMEVRAATALSTSSSNTSATFKSISGSLPVSSPTSTMLTTIGGNMFAGFERLHDRFAFFHAVVHPRDCASDGGIARSLTRDI